MLARFQKNVGFVGKESSERINVFFLLFCFFFLRGRSRPPVAGIAQPTRGAVYVRLGHAEPAVVEAGVRGEHRGLRYLAQVRAALAVREPDGVAEGARAELR